MGVIVNSYVSKVTAFSHKYTNYSISQKTKILWTIVSFLIKMAMVLNMALVVII